MSDDNPKAGRDAPNLSRHEHVQALVKYGVVGITQNAFFYSLSLALIWLGWAAWQAQVVLYPVAVAASFIANSFWSFGNRRKTLRQFRHYVFVYAGMYPLSVSFTWLQENLGIPPWLASLITMAAAVCVTFLALNYWVFGKVKN